MFNNTFSKLFFLPLFQQTNYKQDFYMIYVIDSNDLQN